MKPRDIPKPLNRRARIEPLSVLPVFLDLRGKLAIVIGESEGALWKAELVLQSGARLKLICVQPTTDMLQLVTDSNGAIELVVEDWRNTSFGNASLVIADVIETEAIALAQKARAVGAWVNIVDKPNHCQFQFGSIVNKSPLVIGISTSGSAPVLAQNVRSLIETALPAGIQARVQKASDIRHRINARLATSSQRRDYWKAFFKKAFGFASKMEKGSNIPHHIKATTVDDLTLRDVRALQSADHIFMGDKTDPGILQFARREARRIAMSNTDPWPLESSLQGRAVVIAPD